jgi:hypothetical protein
VVGTTDLVLDRYDDQHYGYLRVEIDAGQLSFGFYPVGNGANTATPADSLTVDLADHTVSSTTSSSARRQGGNVAHRRNPPVRSPSKHP